MASELTQKGINIKHARSYYNADGWLVEHVEFDVPRHNVQMVRYNGDDSAVVVKVDQDIQQMPRAKATGFIRNRI